MQLEVEDPDTGAHAILLSILLKGVLTSHFWLHRVRIARDVFYFFDSKFALNIQTTY